MNNYLAFPLTLKKVLVLLSIALLMSNLTIAQHKSGANNRLQISRMLDADHANTGDTVFYNVTIKNIHSKTLSNVQVLDSLHENVFVVSLKFEKGKFDDMNGIWSISELKSNEAITLRYGVKVVEPGLIAFNSQTASIDNKPTEIFKPFSEKNVVLTVPFKVCTDLGQSIVLTADTGFKSYQWYKNGQAMPSQINNYLVAYSAGEYSVSYIDKNNNLVESIHPFIVEESCESLSKSNTLFKLVKRN